MQIIAKLQARAADSWCVDDTVQADKSTRWCLLRLNINDAKGVLACFRIQTEASELKEILVKTLMTEGVTCLQPEATLREAVDSMVENRYSCIIIEDEGTPLGIITERDLVKVLAKANQEDNLSLPVVDFMTSPILRLNQNESLFDALVVSKAEKVRHLPVVDDADKLVGIVTLTDLANAHFHVTELQSEMIEKAIHDKTDVLQKINEELQALSMEDHLMEIGNRRAMEVDLDHIHASALRYRQPYSIILIDVDCFKLYNDHYGHQMGDDVLKRVADLLKESVRAADRVYRYGGEEILVVLPHTNGVQVGIPSEKLVKVVAADKIPHAMTLYGSLTISCGGACAMDGDSVIGTWAELVEQADQCLYRAKENGRNRAEIAEQSVGAEPIAKSA